MTDVEGDSKAPFSIATTLGYREGATPFFDVYNSRVCVCVEFLLIKYFTNVFCYAIVS